MRVFPALRQAGRVTWAAAAMLTCLLLALLPGGASAAQRVEFERDVAPLLEHRCLRCHRPGNAEGELSLATINDLRDNGYLVPGDPDDSPLLEIIGSQDGEPPMMPKEGAPLTDAEVATLRRWIAEGAEWPEERLLREPSRADKTWWSLQPLAEDAPPDGSDMPPAWRKHEIDRFVYARLRERGLTPSPRADKRALIRRATYDLTGLPPTPQEVADFLNDDSEEAYERLIDRLLASPRYGERWGRHWLDVIRFGESNGFERNVIINNLWPFRDYVIRSFNEDKPFDRLVLEHLAGDALGAGDPAVEVGTAFLVAGPYDNVGNQDAVQAAQIRANTIDEMIRTTSESMLGLTLGCSRCHDHKFDPLLQRDYYAMYATFAGVFHGVRTVASPDNVRQRAEQLKPLNDEQAQLQKQRDDRINAVVARANEKLDQYKALWTRPIVDRHGTEETFEPVEARHVRFVVESLDTNPNARTGFRLDEFEIWTAGEQPRNVALLENGGRAEGASRVAEDFDMAYGPELVIDGDFGQRWFATGNELRITLAQPERINRALFSSDRLRSIGRHSKTTFVADYRIEVSLDGNNWTEVAHARDRQPASPAHQRQRLIDLETTDEERTELAAINRRLAQVRGKIRAIPPLPAWWVGLFRPAGGPFHVFHGGDPYKRGATVLPSRTAPWESTAPNYELATDASEQQRRLALARWIVAAENPLTPRVLANRLWHYHFGTGIVDTPSDFGYMGGRPTHPELLDWLARHVHRHQWRVKPMHKLIMLSETYQQSCDHRDQPAQLDGNARLLWRFPPRRLSAEEIRDTMLTVAGKLDTRMGGPGFRLYRYLEDNVATYVPKADHGPETYRRAVYHQNARATTVDLMTEFDCPDNAFSAPRRASTTTPLQALTLMNHQFTLDMAGHLAARLEQQSGEEPVKKQVEQAFLLAFARPATRTEMKACVELVEQHGLRAFCRVLFNTNEFIYLD